MFVFPLSLSSPSLLLSPPKTLKPSKRQPLLRYLSLRHRRNHLSVCAYGDGDGGDLPDFSGDEYFDEELEDIDNEKDYEIEYDNIWPAAAAAQSGEDFALAPLSSGGFISTEGWEADTVVNYRINEDEFHKISLLHCDFFVRRHPDPDENVYDFREMYVSPPDTDVYSIPKVLAPMPQKSIRCTKKNFGLWKTTEPAVERFRDPLYKVDRQIMKVFLTKHYRNRRVDDSDFVLDFEEIYVIDSKTKSITRGKVVVTVPGGKERNRKNDLLIIRDNGTSFKIIQENERDDPQTVIEKKDWKKTRTDLEIYLRKFRDFRNSNWF
ncbi:hypothetical protein LUZ60_015400 [Juncus effusus]|nr:hypothetical protein LUZ60_015400 [Juncus effusus]